MPELKQPLESLINSPIRLALAETTVLVSRDEIPRDLLIGHAEAGVLSSRIPVPRSRSDQLIYLVGPADYNSVLAFWKNFDDNHARLKVTGEWGLRDSGMLYRLSDGTMVVLYRRKEQMPLDEAVFDRVPAADYVRRLDSRSYL